MSADEFDFAAMQAQGNNAGVPELYVLIMTPLPAAPPAMPGEPTPLELHYAYLHRLIAQGTVLLGGPCLGESPIPGQAPVPHGIVVVRVDSREEAEEIARNEPFHQMGWRRNTVMAWTPKFGSLIETLAQSL